MVFLQLAGTVRFYEAVLAALAILAWHFCSVIFDPEVYAVDPAWLSGHSVKRQGTEQSDSEEAGEGDSRKERDVQGKEAAGNASLPGEEKGGGWLIKATGLRNGFLRMFIFQAIG